MQADTSNDRYDVFVSFFSNKRQRRLYLLRNVPLSIAQLNCEGPETSYQTCTLPKNKRRTRKWGPWFVCYTKVS